MNENQMDLKELFARFEWLFRRYQLQKHRNFGPMADPHRGQGRVLALLKLQPEISQKELSNILDIRSQSLGELLVKLEKCGHITRTPSEKDRRVMIIRLTDKGRTTAEEMENTSDDDPLFSCLNEDEQQILAQYMIRIIEDLENRFGVACDFMKQEMHGRPPFDGRDFEHMLRNHSEFKKHMMEGGFPFEAFGGYPSMAKIKKRHGERKRTAPNTEEQKE